MFNSISNLLVNSSVRRLIINDLLVNLRGILSELKMFNLQSGRMVNISVLRLIIGDLKVNNSVLRLIIDLPASE